MERYFQIGKVNLRHNLLPHIIISVTLLSLAPFLMGVNNLETSDTAKVLEMFVALLGIILLTPLFLPEQNNDIKDLVNSKYTSSIVVYLIRLFEAGLSLIILVGGFTIILRYNNCTFPFMNYFLGTLAEAVFLGGLGIFTYRVCDQLAVAYMLPIMYYVMAFGGGKKLLKDFYPFSMIYGSYVEKIYLVSTGVVLILLALSYPYILKYTHKLLNR